MKAAERFQENETAYRCPLCHAPLRAEGSSFLCGNGHCFDIAAKGYVNFIPAQKKSAYGRDLFQSRRRIFEAGFYDEVLASVERFAGKSVLDAGCGEGYYARGLAADKRRVFAADIEKDAVKMAAGGGSDVQWIVADLANLPFADGAVDTVLNVLSPANYGEFGRVLQTGGMLVKVVPGTAYLQEIRNIIGKEPYEGHDVEEYFSRHVDLLHKEALRYRRAVTREQFADFLKMTPLARDADVAGLEAGGVDTITIDLALLAGRMK